MIEIPFLLKNRRNVESRVFGVELILRFCWVEELGCEFGSLGKV